MQIQDDRTEEQKKTHRYAIVGTDRFMSGWGKAKGGASYAAWAVPQDLDAIAHVEYWVERRGDMRRVRVVDLDTWRPRGRGHAHIYVVEAGHPALGRRARDCAACA